MSRNKTTKAEVALVNTPGIVPCSKESADIAVQNRTRELRPVSSWHLRDGEGFLPSLENHFLLASAPQGRPNDTPFSERLREVRTLGQNIPASFRE